jgi:hypothetical protein
MDELHIAERALPLDNLDANFIATDALVIPEGHAPAWPQHPECEGRAGAQPSGWVRTPWPRAVWYEAKAARLKNEED